MTRLVETIEQVRDAVAIAKAAGRTVGLVPTMGALHDGHLRLVERARQEAGFVAVSIFVNPTQFAPNEDYARYPRTLDDDLRACEAAGADLAFAPEVGAIYRRGRSALTKVEVPGLSSVLEGAVRPGHFRGVVTVVLKLFNIVRPDLAFFGQKDYQQQLIIRRMVDDLDVPVVVRTVETVREPDGLAMSSRNRYLDPEQRRAATVLFRALARAKEAAASGERDAGRVRQVLAETIESEPSARLDYAEVADAETLEPSTKLTAGHPTVGLLAVRFGSTRLIDNAIILE